MKEIIVLAMLLTCGCTTRLIPEAETVKVTENSSDVKGCTRVAFVEAHPPFTTRTDALNVMKNETAGAGGNVLFLTNYSLKATGAAYRCD